MDKIYYELSGKDQINDSNVFHEREKNSTSSYSKRYDKNIRILMSIMLILLIIILGIFIYVACLHSRKLSQINEQMVSKENIEEIITKINVKNLGKQEKNSEDEQSFSQITNKLKEIEQNLNEKSVIQSKTENELSQIKTEIEKIENGDNNSSNKFWLEKISILEKEIQILKEKNFDLQNEINLLKEIKEDETSEQKNKENENISEEEQIKPKKDVVDPEKIDSIIIESEEELKLIEDRLLQTNPGDSMEYLLLYRASEDGEQAKSFHFNCDDIKGTLVLIKTDKGRKFGGYTSQLWNDNNGLWRNDETVFCFDLIKNTIYNSIDGKQAIFPNKDFGPSFGNTVFKINDFAFQYGGTTGSDLNFEYENSKLNGGERTFKIVEIEVYKVSFLTEDDYY